MKLVESKEPKAYSVTFGEIGPGECFRCFGKNASVVYIKANNDHSPYENTANAICLKNGSKVHKADDTRVYVFERAEIVLNESFNINQGN